MNIETKIRKLLALGERAGTEAEAQAAMAAAHRLLAEYNLDMADIRTHSDNQQEGVIQDRSTSTKLANTYWVDTVYASVAKLYFSRAYVEKGHSNRRILIIGRPSNVTVIKYIGEYLIRTAEKMAQSLGSAANNAAIANDSPFHLRRWRSSFKLGFAVRICQRVEEQISRAKAGDLHVSDGRALVLAPLYDSENEAIMRYVREKGWKTGTSRASANLQSGSGFRAGKAAAETANLANNAVKTEVVSACIGS